MPDPSPCRSARLIAVRLITARLITARLAAPAADLRHVLAIAADGLAALATDLGHVGPILADPLAAPAADVCHVLPVLAHHLAAFLAGGPGLVARELVRRSLLVRRLPCRSAASLCAADDGEGSLGVATSLSSSISSFLEIIPRSSMLAILLSFSWLALIRCSTEERRSASSSVKGRQSPSAGPVVPGGTTSSGLRIGMRRIGGSPTFRTGKHVNPGNRREFVIPLRLRPA